MLAQEFASAEKLNAIFTFLWKNHIELWEDNLHHSQRIGKTDAGLRFEDRRSGLNEAVLRGERRQKAQSKP